ncbi:hypothetical protein RRG08_036990 [Elysia crispata]|uniref:Uncharacterized protein n=1 Tax=Elysia crispata TaxID=231223 RepID=A0AAE1CLV3_9GAST|nr:hypothetical protein RRG08_036990 [Elysia crispata]
MKSAREPTESGTTVDIRKGYSSGRQTEGEKKHGSLVAPGSREAEARRGEQQQCGQTTEGDPRQALARGKAFDLTPESGEGTDLEK